ncbi:MAG: molecular chaperone TorD family protein [Acidobacteriota bacterium]
MTPSEVELYDGLSDVLTYPGPDYQRKVSRCAGMLQRTHPQAEGTFNQFAQRIAPKAVHELEELFTRTFDLDPACCLEVGWHLFGENYERGRFLVRMRQELSRSQVRESTELPDHLTHVLRALARMDSDMAAGFVAEGVLPALEKMMNALEGRDNPYECLLQAIRTVLQEAVPQQPEVAHD